MKEPNKVIGQLHVYRGTNLAMEPVLRVYWADGGRHDDMAQMEAGALSGTVLSYGMRTSRAFRVEVQDHLDQLKTLFLLWR